MSDRETFAAEDAVAAGQQAAEANDESGDLIESPEEVPGHISPEKLDQILEEVAAFEVHLEEDPTAPELGARYLQARIAQCRQYLNRTQYYLQITRRYERNLKRAERAFEMDLELKLAEKLADDVIVRQQPSAQERRAAAIISLKAEHENLGRFKIELQNLDGTIRIVKARYDDLRHTNQDIKLQRQLVKDDREGWGEGEGYTRPQARQDGTIPGGMAPPVKAESLDPEDLLDPEKRPEDLPEPKSLSHAKQISNFFSGSSQARRPAAPGPDSGGEKAEEAPAMADGIKQFSYDDLLRD